MGTPDERSSDYHRTVSVYPSAATDNRMAYSSNQEYLGLPDKQDYLRLHIGPAGDPRHDACRGHIDAQTSQGAVNVGAGSAISSGTSAQLPIQLRPSGGSAHSPPAAGPGRNSLGEVHMSLQDMLAEAARIQNDILTTGASQTGSSLPPRPQSVPNYIPANAPPMPPDPSGAISSFASHTSPALRPSAAASRGSSNPGTSDNTIASASMGTAGSGRFTTQARGPLEALRDELFSGLTLPEPMTPKATAPPSPPAATLFPMGLNGSTVAPSSPAPSAATHLEHDLSSIYSIPESGLNMVAQTPMSITTAAVSELDTPSSARSRDEEYDKSFVSPRTTRGGAGSRLAGGFVSPESAATAAAGSRAGVSYDIPSGYDDYVSPAAWTSLRERHSAGKGPLPADAASDSTVSTRDVAMPTPGQAGGPGGSLSATPGVPSQAATAITALASGASFEWGTDPEAEQGAAPSPPPASPSSTSAANLHMSEEADVGREGGRQTASLGAGCVRTLQPLLVSVDAGVGTGGVQGSGTPSSGPPTLSAGFCDLVCPGPGSSSLSASGAIPTACDAREPAGGGQVYSSLSYGAPTGDGGSLAESEAASRPGGLSPAGRDGGGQALPETVDSPRSSSAGGSDSSSMTECGLQAGVMAVGLDDAGGSAASQDGGSRTFDNPLFAPDPAHSDGGMPLTPGYNGGGNDSGGGGPTSGACAVEDMTAVPTPLDPPVHPRTSAEAAAPHARIEGQQWAGAVAPSPEPVKDAGALHDESRAATGAERSTSATPAVAVGRAQRPPLAPNTSSRAMDSFATPPTSTTASRAFRLGPEPAASAVLTPASPAPSHLAGGVGGSPSSSGISAALIGAVPQQNRQERVRDWAEGGADFDVVPPATSSVVSALTTPTSSWGGCLPVEAAGMQEPRASLAASIAVRAPQQVKATGQAAAPLVVAATADGAATPTTAAASESAAQSAPVATILPAANTMRADPSTSATPSGSVAATATTRTTITTTPGVAAVAGWTPDANVGAILDAELERLLSMLSSRGARSEVQARLAFDSFRSAVVNAVTMPRPSSTPGLASLTAAMAEAASGEQQQQQGQGQAGGDGAAKVAAVPPPVAAGQDESGGHAAARGGEAGAMSGQETPAPALASCSFLAAVDAARVLHPGLPHSDGLPEHPHPHLQPHLPLNPHLHHHQTHPAPGSQPHPAGLAAPPVPSPMPTPMPMCTPLPPAAQQPALSPSASLGSIESEVAAERLKAKTRAYLQKEVGGDSAAAAATHSDAASSVCPSSAGSLAPPPPPPPRVRHDASLPPARAPPDLDLLQPAGTQHDNLRPFPNATVAPSSVPVAAGLDGPVDAGLDGPACRHPSVSAGGPVAPTVTTATAAAAAREGDNPAASQAPQGAAAQRATGGDVQAADVDVDAMAAMDALISQAEAELKAQLRSLGGAAGSSGGGNGGGGVQASASSEQPPLSTLEDLLRQLRQLTRSSSGGGGGGARVGSWGTSREASRSTSATQITEQQQPSEPQEQHQHLRGAPQQPWPRQQLQQQPRWPLDVGHRHHEGAASEWPTGWRITGAVDAGACVPSGGSDGSGAAAAAGTAGVALSIGSISLLASTVVESSASPTSRAPSDGASAGGHHGDAKDPGLAPATEQLDHGQSKRPLSRRRTESPSANSPSRTRRRSSREQRSPPGSARAAASGRHQAQPQPQLRRRSGSPGQADRATARLAINGVSAAAALGTPSRHCSPPRTSEGEERAGAEDCASYLDLAMQAARIREQLDAQQQHQQQHQGQQPSSAEQPVQPLPWMSLQAVSGNAAKVTGDGGAVALQYGHAPRIREQMPRRHTSEQVTPPPAPKARLGEQRMMQARGDSGTAAAAADPAACAPLPAPAAAPLISTGSADWQAALEAKLLPYNAARQRTSASSLLDASSMLVEWQAGGAREAGSPGRGGGGGGPAGACGSSKGLPEAASRRGGAEGGSGYASHHHHHQTRTRPVSPATTRDAPRQREAPGGGARGVGPRDTSAAFRSAPVTPRRGNSPSRAAAPAGPAVAGGGARGGGGGGGGGGGVAGSTVAPSGYSSRSPLGGVASRDGRGWGSILDRATPLDGAGAGAGAGAVTSPGATGMAAAGGPPRSAPAPLPSEPISIMRPFAWQERETRHWLEDLGLQVSPAEESLPLLDNPLRNGLLLAALATRLTGAALPAGVVTSPPRDVRSARTNILCSLDHLDLLAANWAAPADAERRARAQAAAAEMAAAIAAKGGGGSGASRSPSPVRNPGAGPTAGSSGIIAIKALGSAGRGYALRLKERQLRAGLGLVAEVECVLAGMVDSIWGLLNFIRLACAPHYLRGSAAAGGSGRRLGDEAPRRSFNVRGGPGVDGGGCLLPAPSAAPSTAPDSAGNSRRPTPVRAGGGCGNRASGDGSSAHNYRHPASPARTPGRKAEGAGGAAAGIIDSAHSGTPPRRLGPAVSSNGRPGSNGRGRPTVPIGATADPRGCPSVSLLSSKATQDGAASAAGGGKGAGVGGSSNGGSGGGGCSTPDGGNILYRPLWPRITSLPYTPSELAALEASLLRWLQESGAISRREAAEGFTALLPMFEDGTFVCWLVSNLGGQPIVGAHRRPLTEAARRTNWLKAIEALRKLPAMSRRFLVFEEALIHCERAPLTGLLEDLHRLAGGVPPAPSTLQPNAKPYLPYTDPEPSVQMLPPGCIAVNRGGGVTPSPRALAAQLPSGSQCQNPQTRSHPEGPQQGVRQPAPPQKARGGSGGSATAVASASPSPRVAWAADNDTPAAAAAAAAAPAGSGGETRGRRVTGPHGSRSTTPTRSPTRTSERMAEEQAAERQALNNVCRGSTCLSPRGGLRAPGDGAAVPAGGEGEGARPRSAAAATGWRAGASGGEECVSGPCNGAAGLPGQARGGGAGGGGGGLITDRMVTPVKAAGASGGAAAAPRGRPDQRKFAAAAADAAAVLDLRASYPAADAAASSRALDALLCHTSRPPSLDVVQQDQMRRYHKDRRLASNSGSRSEGGALAASASATSPALSPRLRLVPAAWL